MTTALLLVLCGLVIVAQRICSGFRKAGKAEMREAAAYKTKPSSSCIRYSIIGNIVLIVGYLPETKVAKRLEEEYSASIL